MWEKEELLVTCTADTIGQTFCFANWVQNKGSLSMICMAPGVFIKRNMILQKKKKKKKQVQEEIIPQPRRVDTSKLCLAKV